MLGEVGESGQREAAAGGGGGGENGPLRSGPWEGWLWWWGAPAWAVLLCSRPLVDSESSLLWLLVPGRLDRGGEVSGEGVSSDHHVLSGHDGAARWKRQAKEGQRGGASQGFITLSHRQKHFNGLLWQDSFNRTVRLGEVPGLRSLARNCWLSPRLQEHPQCRVLGPVGAVTSTQPATPPY